MNVGSYLIVGRTIKLALKVGRELKRVGKHCISLYFQTFWLKWQFFSAIQKRFSLWLKKKQAVSIPVLATCIIHIVYARVCTIWDSNMIAFYSDRNSFHRWLLCNHRKIWQYPVAKDCYISTHVRCSWQKGSKNRFAAGAATVKSNGKHWIHYTSTHRALLILH